MREVNAVRTYVGGVDGVGVNGVGASCVRMDGGESGCDDDCWCKSE